MRIDVYSDMVCPWCRIGKKNMSDAIAQWEQATGEPVEVTYHAYQLDPTLPPEGLPFNSAMEKKMGGPERLRPMLQRVTEAGAAVGLRFNFDQVARMPSTLLAHRISTLLPASAQEAWIDAVMEQYFEQGQDIAQLAVLLDIVRSIGGDADQIARQLADGDGLDDVNQDIGSAQKIGISGVPFFVLDGKYALSGAYPSAQFLEAFRKISQSS